MIGVMPKFSIKDLLIATAIVAVGLTIALFALNPRWEPYIEKFWYVLLAEYLVGCAIAGAGLMYPFKRSKLGAKLGMVVGVLLMLSLVVIAMYSYS